MAGRKSLLHGVRLRLRQLSILHELIQDILGPYGQLERGLPEGLELGGGSARGQDSSWTFNFLWSRAGTIYAGSSEIQKNIIGERVLKLPREPRADRQPTTGA